MTNLDSPLKIGFSTSTLYQGSVVERFLPAHVHYALPHTVHYLDTGMVNFAMPALNALPVMLGDWERPFLASRIAELDGVILVGGVDVAPSSYGQTPINAELWPGDPRRDAYELKIIELALRAKKPILGICRGHQLLNVFFGGTLYQDLVTERTELSTSVSHRNDELYEGLTHAIQLAPRSFLRGIYPGKEQLVVNSIHHQGIKDLATVLTPSAYALGDNLVEAFELNRGEEQVLACQWHPEHNNPLTCAGADLFAHFAQLCRRKR